MMKSTRKVLGRRDKGKCKYKASGSEEEVLAAAEQELWGEQCELEEKRAAERPNPSVSGKLCFVCLCKSGPDASYNIYILDRAREFDAERFVPISPNLRLDFPTFLAHSLCVLGSTLFVVEPSDDLVYPKKKSLFSFDLSSLNYDSKVSLWLEKPKVVCGKERSSRLLSSLSPMNYPKRYPAAVATPDGKKILVFSTLLNYNKGKHNGVISDEIDIELYDPITDTWEVLPGIPVDNCEVVFDITSYAFIDNSTFLLQTEIGDFTLDLDEKTVLESTSSFRGCFFLQAQDDIILTSMGAYDMKRKDPMSKFFPFPLSARDEEERPKRTTRAITLLDDGGGVENNGECVQFCVLEVGLTKGTRLPSMFVDVFSIDLVKYKADKEKKGDHALLEACKLRTFKFVPHDQQCRDFYARELFSI